MKKQFGICLRKINEERYELYNNWYGKLIGILIQDTNTPALWAGFTATGVYLQSLGPDPLDAGYKLLKHLNNDELIIDERLPVCG